MTLATDVSRRESRVADILQPTGDVLPQAYTGKGVIVGVIDTGFDFQHPVFKDAEGRSRIKAVYNPFGGSGSEAYDAYGNLLPGTVYDTPEQIEKLTTDTYKQMHGTHTASTAAGTHHGDWGGMAPDADLVLCLFYPSDDATGYDASLGSSWYLLNSLAYLQGYVKNSGQRAVISMSLNSHSGPHNGKGD
ncbi:MAG: S8 family serine peptidase [Bacteroidales bacterium]|nr:S8 family serine peptidase [Bacteroidales bacterium]MDD6897761.1 S8 family serine peptidase [Bacteroidales bacterium]MDY2693679.1 S8 family serine peptidase [Prevotella sp.]MDY4732521.1 S8 family serine peptidase [Prevotella sp.]MDY6028537.1 S8 family serine peptidase [Prevotella sp.]